MSFLSNLLGGGGASGPHDGAINADLKRLNALRPDLGDQAAAYVRTGAGETVLSTIATLCKANELEVCRAWVDSRNPVALRRRELFARADPYDTALMKRYADVICAAAGAIPTKSASGFAREATCGSDATPRAVRIFLTEAFLGLQPRQQTWPPKPHVLETTGMLLDRALEMTRLLGGDVADFFDALYVSEDNYTRPGELYRRAVAVLPAVQAHQAAFIVAAKRMPAAARADAINNLTEWGLAKTDGFVEFLVDQAGEGSKGVREAANAALRGAPSETVTPLAIALLQRGDADQRAGMVDVLARVGAPAALEALRAHRETEKTARIAAAIDTALSLDARRQSGDSGAAPDDATGYTALDGQRIAVPPMKALPDGDTALFGDADRDALNAIIDKQNEQIMRANQESKGYRAPLIPNGHVSAAIALFNDGGRIASDSKRNNVGHQLSWGPQAPWTRAALQKLPLASALRISMRLVGRVSWALNPQAAGPGAERIQSFLNGPDGDLRHIEQLEIDAGAVIEFGDYRQRTSHTMRKGDLLRTTLQEARFYDAPALANLPRGAVWPYLAENLDIFDEALGVSAPGTVKLDRVAAVDMLALLPATPARYYAPLLEIATGDGKKGRAKARAMMTAAPEVEARLIALLDDSRQAIRAGAAEWLSARRDPNAQAALHKRLKKEKSELARAAILSALKRFGEDISDIVGPKALIAEAEKGLKSAKFDKLAWLPLDHLARVRFRDGTAVPNEVPRWWVLSAFKLKQPGGNALFEIYLDQLDPTDAEIFSTWVLETWIGYDTARPDEAGANAHAKAHAKGRAQSYRHWQPGYTEEQAFASLKAEYMSQYPNSGAESKGVLALATRAPSAMAADRVRAYLKAHGQRTSQASALLEMLAGKADPVALQVVIAAATRLKQKGVQKFAAELIAKVAEARDWTLDELADRTVPTAGFDEDGLLTLPCGEDGKAYEARLGPDLGVILRNPSGKEVAGLPSGQDEATATSKKQLATTKKELKQIVAMQTARLYEALCAERVWSIDDWTHSFHRNPVMRRMVERIVWLGLDAEGNLKGAFRPTAEGDFTNTDDASVDINTFATARIAHGALFGDAEATAWSQHLTDYEVKPLFIQFGRSLLRIAETDANKTSIEDRKGWLTDAFTIRGAASKLGYERGGALDGGFFNEYRKPFSSAGLAAVIEFTGNSLPEQNVAAALMSLRFERATSPGVYSGAVRLKDVPPVLLSECWNDYHAMAAKAKFDAEWEKRSPW